MKNVVVILGIALLAVGCSESGKRIPKDTKHNIVIKFNGRDSQIPKDGELLIIQSTQEDTIIVQPATLDDCRRILEEHGQG